MRSVAPRISSLDLLSVGLPRGGEVIPFLLRPRRRRAERSQKAGNCVSIQLSHLARSSLLMSVAFVGAKSRRPEVPAKVPVSTPRRALRLRAIPHCQNETRQALEQGSDS